ncbi:MAG: radical SAM protein [Acidobacteriota bacterium]
MKLVIVNPPSPFLLDDRAFLTLGPLQIAAVAREVAGWDVEVCDLTGHARGCSRTRHDRCFDDVMADIDRRIPLACEGADLVGFYSTAITHPGTYRAMRALAQLGSSAPSSVLGGPHANSAPEACVEDGFTWVVAADQGGGGGEPGFLEVLRRVKDRSGERGVVRVPSKNGESFPNDRWPYPARDLVDMESYRYFINGQRASHIVSAAGCPFACNFCAHWDGYRKLVHRSIPHIEGEIREIKKRWDVHALMEYSDECNLYPDFDGWMDMMRRNGITWRGFFKAGSVARIMSEAMIRKMAESGCYQVACGIESGSEAVLKKIGKGATKRDNTNFVVWCVKHGVRPKAFMQVGLPGETPETVKETRDWLVAMAAAGLKDIDVAITTPYEGTPIYEHPEDWDLAFDFAELDRARHEGFGRGRPGEYVSFVSTPTLSRDDLVKARLWLDEEFAKAASMPGEIRDDG